MDSVETNTSQTGFWFVSSSSYQLKSERMSKRERERRWKRCSLALSVPFSVLRHLKIYIFSLLPHSPILTHSHPTTSHFFIHTHNAHQSISFIHFSVPISFFLGNVATAAALCTPNNSEHNRNSGPVNFNSKAKSIQLIHMDVHCHSWMLKWKCMHGNRFDVRCCWLWKRRMAAAILAALTIIWAQL